MSERANPSRRSFLLAGALATIAGGVAIWHFGPPLWGPIYRKIAGRRTVDDVVATYGPEVDAKFAPLHATKGISYPPKELALIATKMERNLELWVRGHEGPFQRLLSYPVLGASGGIGPKLLEGDRQVPEGVYRVLSLNPNSRFHLSLELDYPNEFDRAQAAKDGRTNLGGEIFVHGGSWSIGCLAMGDDVIQELFVLVARTGPENVRVVIAPQEPAQSIFPAPEASTVPWARELHEQILNALERVRGSRDA
jgi:hypothetical protein